MTAMGGNSEFFPLILLVHCVLTFNPLCFILMDKITNACFLGMCVLRFRNFDPRLIMILHDVKPLLCVCVFV